MAVRLFFAGDLAFGQLAGEIGREKDECVAAWRSIKRKGRVVREEAPKCGKSVWQRERERARGGVACMGA